MERFFAIDMPARRFCWNTLLFSLLGLIPSLGLYVLVTPGFGSMLVSGGMPLSRFLRQVLTNGLPVVFAVNYVGFFLYAWSNARSISWRKPTSALLIDPLVRLAVFISLHVVIYVMSADWFGSFGGSRITAMKVVAPTLARSAFFENLSGAYLYASLISALPLYTALIEKSRLLHLLRLTQRRRAIAFVLAIAWFGVFLAVLTLLALVAEALQAS